MSNKATTREVLGPWFADLPKSAQLLARKLFEHTHANPWEPFTASRSQLLKDGAFSERTYRRAKAQLAATGHVRVLYQPSAADRFGRVPTAWQFNASVPPVSSANPGSPTASPEHLHRGQNAPLCAPPSGSEQPGKGGGEPEPLADAPLVPAPERAPAARGAAKAPEGRARLPARGPVPLRARSGEATARWVPPPEPPRHTNRSETAPGGLPPTRPDRAEHRGTRVEIPSLWRPEAIKARIEQAKAEEQAARIAQAIERQRRARLAQIEEARRAAAQRELMLAQVELLVRTERDSR